MSYGYFKHQQKHASLPEAKEVAKKISLDAFHNDKHDDAYVFVIESYGQIYTDSDGFVRSFEKLHACFYKGEISKD